MRRFKSAASGESEFTNQGMSIARQTWDKPDRAAFNTRPSVRSRVTGVLPEPTECQLKGRVPVPGSVTSLPDYSRLVAQEVPEEKQVGEITAPATDVSSTAILPSTSNNLPGMGATSGIPIPSMQSRGKVKKETTSLYDQFMRSVGKGVLPSVTPRNIFKRINSVKSPEGCSTDLAWFNSGNNVLVPACTNCIAKAEGSTLAMAEMAKSLNPDWHNEHEDRNDEIIRPTLQKREVEQAGNRADDVVTINTIGGNRTSLQKARSLASERLGLPPHEQDVPTTNRPASPEFLEQHKDLTDRLKELGNRHDSEFASLITRHGLDHYLREDSGETQQLSRPGITQRGTPVVADPRRLRNPDLLKFVVARKNEDIRDLARHARLIKDFSISSGKSFDETLNTYYQSNPNVQEKLLKVFKRNGLGKSIQENNTLPSEKLIQGALVKAQLFTTNFPREHSELLDRQSQERSALQGQMSDLERTEAQNTQIQQGPSVEEKARKVYQLPGGRKFKRK